jgi:SAM-dependent methyltransferase
VTTPKPDRPLRRTHLGATDLRTAWEENAEAFIAWARRPDHDSYWHFHRDLFLELVSPPGRRTLDLGCGEGRLLRDLTALGHDVVGVDASPTMVAAARAADAHADVRLADAAALPFADASFDCVVAFMSLQDVDDFEGAIAEAARVLEPAGALCVAIVHPLNSAGRFEGDDAESPFVIRGSYLDRSHYRDTTARAGLEMTFVSEHRPIDAYTEALAAVGFVIERLREPSLPEGGVRAPHTRRWQRVPLFLHLRARAAPRR